MSPVPRAPKLPIHNRVGVLRAERGLPRGQLAELVGINVQSVGALERGDHYPSLDLEYAAQSLPEGSPLPDPNQRTRRRPVAIQLAQRNAAR